MNEFTLLGHSSTKFNMTSSSAIVAGFSQDVHNFAFQTNFAQKNAVDIYPLDAANDYSVNSSLVSHIDYESNELKASEVIFSGWCNLSSKESGKKTKRKRDDEKNNITEEGTYTENFYVNVFSSGKVVVFSSGGKQIVNIIQLKQELSYADTVGSHVWILDSGKIIKKFQYNQSKASKSLHLVNLEGFNDEAVVNFQVLTKGSNSLLGVSCEAHFYLIDPNKKKSLILAKYNVNASIASEFSKDGKNIIIATTSQILIYDFPSGNVVRKWQEDVSKMKIVDEFILILNSVGELSVFSLNKEGCICKITVMESEIIECTSIENSIMIAWLDVNEPKFKTVPFQEIIASDKIVLNEDIEGNTALSETDRITRKNSIDGDEEDNTVSPKKVSKAEQDELTQSLISTLDSGDDIEQITSIMQLDTWSEQRIKSFILIQLQTVVATKRLLEAAIMKLQENLWAKSNSIFIWFKWLITLKGDSFLTKDFRKQLKLIKIGLRSSTETLPTLLGIQGRLELLKKQEQMRVEFAKLNFVEDEVDAENIEYGEAQGDTGDNDDAEDSISYANGEGDTFVDASEHRDSI
ncbi:hypothetical protein HG535_0E01460 [Zygotorulaspora mrakii]|uniref:Small-subunit processome Utp12 domain-containing protein n=1 Tax=Zygotorulaspora mrakii TaxID=42260 RepID=A0A7H9B5L9_ZYGMR|nr:uncharacterized protein HG535_0E01460 [Zygotorulaspora mrakii]QLG73062.1 hypothetical protein HG535_0E01460 [Zygotorulaspora mrakii]